METMQISIDGELGSHAGRMLAEQGYTLADFVAMTLRAYVYESKMPTLYKEPNAETLAAMREADEGILPSARNVEELRRM